jgi:hypothetical protein
MTTKVMRQPKGTKTGGQFAASVNAESVIDLGDIGDLDPPADPSIDNWVHLDRTIDGHRYRVSRFNGSNGVVQYSLMRAKFGGGWRLRYDRFTKRVVAQGVRPRRETATWRDRGEADIRRVVSELEPEASLIDLNGKHYLVDGPSWPLSDSHMSGLSTGEMMMTGGTPEIEVLAYVAVQRRAFDTKEIERPDLLNSINENRRFVDGIEIAVKRGSVAAEANTVGAMKARGL